MGHRSDADSILACVLNAIGATEMSIYTETLEQQAELERADAAKMQRLAARAYIVPETFINPLVDILREKDADAKHKMVSDLYTTVQRVVGDDFAIDLMEDYDARAWESAVKHFMNEGLPDCKVDTPEWQEWVYNNNPHKKLSKPST